jgi:hypothetical protein
MQCMDISKDEGLVLSDEKAFYDALVSKYGQLIASRDLVVELGFSSSAALRQSVHRNKLGFAVFAINNRRGKFAFTKDVATWLAKQQSQITKKVF